MARPRKTLHELDISAQSPADLTEITSRAEEHLDRKQTAYDKNFSNMLVKHMAEGYDFQSFAKVAGVSKATIERWAKERVSFQEAREVGEEAYYHYWLTIGIQGAKGLIKGYNAATWIFTMKNKFGWKDIVENQNKNDNTVYEVQVTKEGRFASARPKIV
jgi:DNA-binding transcriptional regulator YiaG